MASVESSAALGGEVRESVPGSLGRQFIHRLVRKKIAMIAIAYLSVFYFAAVFAPWVAPHDPNAQEFTIESSNAGPSIEHPLGQDALGRDILSRVIYSARTTLLFTFAVVVTGGLVLGLGLGLLAGYRGGFVDTAIMRIGEVLSGLPTLFLIIALTAAFRTRIADLGFWLKDNSFLGDAGPTLVDFTLIVGVTVPFAWIGTSRIVRSQALAIREEEYVTAAELMGASTKRVIVRHILPGVMPLYMVGLSSGMAAIAGTEVALSFLGLGVNPPTASFGSLIEAGFGVRAFAANPHVLLSGGIPVILFFFAWNLLGDALVDILEPRTASR